MKYKSDRIIDGKLRRVIVEDGKIINKQPSREELKNLEIEKLDRRNIKKYTDEELLNYLRRFYEKSGRIPVTNDFSNSAIYPNHNTYKKRFGSWKRSLELAGLDIYTKKEIYTDEELLNYLKIFCKENNRIPIMRDFDNNPRYPNYGTYQKRFGSWNKSLKLVELDIDTMVKQGVLRDTNHKGRLFEIIMINHFENISIDLSGKDRNSPCDGICPNGRTYDAKSSKLHIGGFWSFDTGSERREEIEYYYFGAFNEDYTKLMYVWRVPGDIVEGNSFRVGIRSGEFNVENMKEYDITDKFDKILDIIL